jgi:TusA-related sulfurtransferase
MKRRWRIRSVFLAVALVGCSVMQSYGDDQGSRGSIDTQTRSIASEGIPPGMEMGKMHGSMMMGGNPMMMGVCPMMAPSVDVKVEKIKNGATITLTSDNPRVIRRIQIHAEIMRLMHELQIDQRSKQTE